eukprot:1142153-Pelagomonas_calceolata.AAC.2
MDLDGAQMATCSLKSGLRGPPAWGGTVGKRLLLHKGLQASQGSQFDDDMKRWATFNAPYGCVVCVLCGGLKWDGGISRSFDPINAPVREPGGSAPDEFPQPIRVPGSLILCDFTAVPPSHAGSAGSRYYRLRGKSEEALRGIDLGCEHVRLIANESLHGLSDARAQRKGKKKRLCGPSLAVCIKESLAAHTIYALCSQRKFPSAQEVLPLQEEESAAVCPRVLLFAKSAMHIRNNAFLGPAHKGSLIHQLLIAQPSMERKGEADLRPLEEGALLAPVQTYMHASFTVQLSGDDCV